MSDEDPPPGLVDLLEPAEAAAATGLDALAASAAAFADAQSSANTRRAYNSDWADFSAWCDVHALQALPAAGDYVALYLTARAQDGLAVSTLQRRLAAIRNKHKLADQPMPEGKLLHGAWGGIRRTNGRPSRQKRAIITADLRRIVATLPTTPTGLRNRAILLLGFASAMRREELADLVLDAGQREGRLLRFAPLGIEIVIDASKADQEGQGAIIGVPYGSTDLCPVLAVQSWLQAAGIEAGAVFRAVDRWGHLSAEAMTDRAVYDVIKASAAAAGFDPATIGAHSLRAGMVTQAILNGVELPLIMKVTRHRRVDTLNKYFRLADLFQRSAAGALGL